MDEPDVDQCWQSWQSTYLNIISKCIPKKVLSSRRNLPWINPSICQALFYYIPGMYFLAPRSAIVSSTKIIPTPARLNYCCA